MASKTGAASGGGCAALIAVVLVVGAIVAGVISLAAVVDPFNWMPSVHQIWADCDGDCELAHRFPGFWWHVVANLVYAAAAVLTAISFLGTVAELRSARENRYADAAALDAYRTARGACVSAGALLAALASLALVVSIA